MGRLVVDACDLEVFVVLDLKSCIEFHIISLPVFADTRNLGTGKRLRHVGGDGWRQNTHRHAGDSALYITPVTIAVELQFLSATEHHLVVVPICGYKDGAVTLKIGID